MRNRIVVFLMAAIFSVAAAAQTTAFPRSESSVAQQKVAREVLHELLMLPYYSVFDNLEFRVDGGTVTLLGQVANPTLKSDAEGVVKKVDGVTNVVNNIQVLPTSNMDDRIRHAEFRAIYGDEGLNKYGWGAVPSIHIIVNNGHVTLVGIVDNQMDKQLAETRAKSVPDVFSVDNQLQVANQKVR